MSTSFSELGVPSEVCDVLISNGIKEPFEIQAKVIKDVLAGNDILAKAPTGSGKTLAFGIPSVVNLGKGKSKLPRGLILSPTRELAEQIKKELDPIAEKLGRKILSIYGGTGFGKQTRGLQKGADLIVACPGRLLDLMNQKEVFLKDVDIVVLDEADRMADMGFLPDVKKILQQTNKNRQTLLFSATLDKDVKVLTKDFQKNPKTHEVATEEIDLGLLTHLFYEVHQTDRLKVAAHFISQFNASIVFVRTKHGADRLARQLKRYKISASSIHGGKSQNQRNRALKEFKDGKSKVLVATDVAARGIHVDGVDCVIHFDIPADEKDYLHRSGRTARAGADGTVISLVQKAQKKQNNQMMRKIELEYVLENASELDIQLEETDFVPKSIKKAHDRNKSKNRGQNNKSRKPQNRSKRKKHSGSDDSDKSRRKPRRSNENSDNRSEQDAGYGGSNSTSRKPKKNRSNQKAEGRRSRAKNRDDERGGKSNRSGRKRPKRSGTRHKSVTK